MLLQGIDTHWREHLASLDYLRQGIHLRGYAQKQPKQEYKREAFELFGQLLDSVKNEVTRQLMTVRVQSGEQLEEAAEALESRGENVSNTPTARRPKPARSRCARVKKTSAASRPRAWGSAAWAPKPRRSRASAATTRARAAAARNSSTATASSADPETSEEK